MNRGGWFFFRLANDSQHHNHHDHHWWQYCQWAKRGAMSQTTRGSNYEYWKSSFHSPSYWGKSVADSWDEKDGNGRTKSYCSCWQTENTGATPIFNPRLLVGRRVLADWKLCAWQMMRELKRGVEAAVVDRFDSHRDSYFMKTEEKTLAFQSKSHFRRGESTWAQWQSASDWVSDWVSCGWTGFRIQSLRRSSRSPLF